jgi:hydrogenase maturation protease
MTVRTAAPPVVIIGIGHPYRSDDGAGLAVLGRLESWARPPGVRLIESDGEPARLIHAWEGADLAIVVDAVCPGVRGPGHVYRVELHDSVDVPVTRAVSSHAMGAGYALALATALGRSPIRPVVFGIEGSSFSPGQTLSPEVQAAVDVVAKLIVDEVNCWALRGVRA